MADFVGPDASMPILRSRVHGEQADRFQLLGDGTILKGNGSGSLSVASGSVFDGQAVKSYNVTNPTSPIVAKALGDGTDGLFNWRHDDTAGYLFHLTAGPNMASPAALIGLGVDYGGRGLLVSNKAAGVGIFLNQRATISSATAYGLHGYQESTAAPVVFLQNNPSVTGPAELFVLQAQNADAGTYMAKFLATQAPGQIAGLVSAYDGTLEWRAPLTLKGAIAGTGVNVFTAKDAASVPLTLKAFDVTQSGNLLEWKDSSGASLGRILSNGRLSVPRVVANGASSGVASVYAGGEVSFLPMFVGRRPASQPGPFFQAQDSDGSVMSQINSSGFYMTRKTTAPADAEIASGEMALWFDSTNGAAKLMVKAKQADGTVKTGSLALA